LVVSGKGISGGNGQGKRQYRRHGKYSGKRYHLSPRFLASILSAFARTCQAFCRDSWRKAPTRAQSEYEAAICWWVIGAM